jgi:hypothetical protein
MTSTTKLEVLRDQAEKIVTINIKGVPIGVRNKFKAVCARKGTSMVAELVKFMSEFNNESEGTAGGTRHTIRNRAKPS